MEEESEAITGRETLPFAASRYLAPENIFFGAFFMQINNNDYDQEN
jgi:hypothetical protein